MTADSDISRWEHILASLPSGAREWLEHGLMRGGNIVLKSGNYEFLEFRIGLETLAYTETRRKPPGHRMMRISGGPDDYAPENFIALSVPDKGIAAPPRSASGYKGVHAQPTGEAFQARYRNKNYGTYDTEEFAARRRDIAACQDNRPHKYLNFPEEHAACSSGICEVLVPVANLHPSVKFRADATEIRGLREQGLSYEAISERLGVSRSTIGKILAPLGMGQPKAQCGTPSGAQRHYRQGEKPCEACRTALSGKYARQQAANAVAELWCSVPDCGKPVFGRGWCAKHWGAWQRYGDPMAGREPNPRSGYHGVKKQANGSTWQAHVKVNGKGTYLGNFPSAEDAARARDAYLVANGLHLRSGKGPAPKLNFPDEHYDAVGRSRT